MNRKKMALLLVLVAAAGFAGWKFFGKKSTTTATTQTAQAEKGTLVTSVSASGAVLSGSNSAITTQASGVVANVYVKAGDKVIAGQKLADVTLDQDAQQRQVSAWSAYLSAQNQVTSAQNNFNSLQAAEFTANQKLMNDAVERNLDSTDPTYITEHANWLQAEADYKKQTAVVNQAQVGLASAWTAYQQVSSAVTAPISGTIAALAIAPGMPITTSSSTTSNSGVSSTKLGSIQPPEGKLLTTVALSEVDAVKITPGLKATLTLDALPDKTFTGKVLVVNTEGSVSSGVTTYPATIEFDTLVSGIYPNMAVTAKIITAVKNDVILVPSAAVTTSASGQSTVRVMKNSKETTVDVTIGNANDTQTEIVSGVAEGDTVVIGSATSRTTTTTGGTSPFSAFGGRGFGGGAVGR